MKLLMLGKSVKAIGDELCIAQSTVRTHTRNMYRKLDVHSRGELFELIA